MQWGRGSFEVVFKRSIFQTFRKTDSYPDFFLSLELETLYFDYMLFFTYFLLCIVSENLDNIAIRHYKKQVDEIKFLTLKTKKSLRL